MVGLMTLLLLGAGCDRRAPIVMAQPSVPPIQSAAAKAASLAVTRTPETAPGLLGSFTIAQGKTGETLRFFGTRTTITQATVQQGPTPARPITQAEAKQYGDLLALARPSAQLNDLRALLAGWSQRRPSANTGPTAQAANLGRPLR